jgi:S-adenosylmethionine hydrolase
MPVIALTTDFGTRDWFAGTMKGVILGINPRAEVVDLTHEIAPGDIRSGAFALNAACHFFPKGTIHVAVVDPGVGSSRRAITVQTTDYIFVGPDNGVLSWALAKQEIKAGHELENADYFLPDVSATFHGRDVFAPVAAHLSRGVPVRKLGPRLKEFVLLPWPEAVRNRRGIEGEVIFIDRFGNAITNIPTTAFAQLRRARAAVFLGGKCVCPLGDFYESVPKGKPVAVPGSSGFIEIAINGGNAAQRLRLHCGEALTLRWQ